MREEWHPAEFVDRFGAEFLDLLFVNGLVWPTVILVDRLPKNAAGILGDHPSSVATYVVLLVWFFLNLTYMVGRTGQSLGRKLSGLKVVTADGDPIGFWRALGRNIFAVFISAPIFYLGFIWVVWDTDKQAWHDKVFRTYVLRRVVL
jgi:Mce-associated membrane protein